LPTCGPKSLEKVVKRSSVAVWNLYERAYYRGSRPDSAMKDFRTYVGGLLALAEVMALARRLEVGSWEHTDRTNLAGGSLVGIFACDINLNSVMVGWWWPQDV
jgi:hypothetical protein